MNNKDEENLKHLISSSKGKSLTKKGDERWTRMTVMEMEMDTPNLLDPEQAKP